MPRTSCWSWSAATSTGPVSSCGGGENENADTDERYRFMAGLAAQARQADPSRLVAAACLINRERFAIEDRLADHLDIIGINPQSDRDRPASAGRAGKEQEPLRHPSFASGRRSNGALACSELEQEAKRVRQFILPFLAAILLAASSGRLAAQAAENPMCKLFTQKEAAAYVGASVGNAESGLLPGSSACSWSDEGADHKMSISVFPAGNALQLKAWGFESWEGFRALPNIGSKAYVARTPIMKIMDKTMGGEWQAGAIVGSDYVAVGLKGPKGNADAAVALLKEAIKRRQQ